MRPSRGMGDMSKKKLKNLKEGGKVKGYELTKAEEERKETFESKSPFKSKSMAPTERLSKGGKVPRIKMSNRIQGVRKR
jgi:hypothetical protein|tara:strand:- start:276 stop:512 length:237 start_codon:yes stop_codon:yes gene_type:complete